MYVGNFLCWFFHVWEKQGEKATFIPWSIQKVGFFKHLSRVRTLYYKTKIPERPTPPDEDRNCTCQANFIFKLISIYLDGRTSTAKNHREFIVLRGKNKKKSETKQHLIWMECFFPRNLFRITTNRSLFSFYFTAKLSECFAHFAFI